MSELYKKSLEYYAFTVMIVYELIVNDNYMYAWLQPIVLTLSLYGTEKYLNYMLNLVPNRFLLF